MHIHVFPYKWESPCGVMAKVLKFGREKSELEHHSSFLFRTIYPWERYETTYPSSYYGSSTRIALALNNPQRLICY